MLLDRLGVDLLLKLRVLSDLRLDLTEGLLELRLVELLRTSAPLVEGITDLRLGLCVLLGDTLRFSPL